LRFVEHFSIALVETCPDMQATDALWLAEFCEFAVRGHRRDSKHDQIIAIHNFSFGFHSKYPVATIIVIVKHHHRIPPNLDVP